jgi:hypothetical protein
VRIDARRVASPALAIVIAGAAACAPNPSPSPTSSIMARPPTEPPTTASAPLATTASTQPASSTAEPTNQDSGPAVLVLLGTPGAMRLDRLDGRGSTPILVPVDTRWVAGRPSHGLLATVGADGRIFATKPVPAGGRPEWQEVAVDPTARRWLGWPPAVAVADPTGAAIAAVATDPGSGALESHLVIVGRTGGRAKVVAVPGTWDGRAPAWLGPDRLVVSTRDRTDRAGLVTIDLAAGGTERWGAGIAAFAVSSDGSTIAWQGRDDGRIFIGPIGGAMAGQALDALAIGGRPRVAAQLLLDATGRRLAVAWLDDAGDTTDVATYERGVGGWALARTWPVPGDLTRLVLVSLDP